MVVVQQHGEVHVVAHRVHPVRRADAAAVSIAGVHEDVQIRARHLHTLRDRQRAAVDPVEPISLHVVREAARAADPGDEHRLLCTQLVIAAQPLHGGEDCIVAAAVAPARHPALVILEVVVLLVHAKEAMRGGRCHELTPHCASLAHIAAQMLPGLIGRPRTSLQQSTSTR